MYLRTGIVSELYIANVIFPIPNENIDVCTYACTLAFSKIFLGVTKKQLHIKIVRSKVNLKALNINHQILDYPPT